MGKLFEKEMSEYLQEEGSDTTIAEYIAKINNKIKTNQKLNIKEKLMLIFLEKKGYIKKDDTI